VAARKRDAAIALVRMRIADGTLKPGGAAPSGAALARETGLQDETCRRALRDLIADGTLTRGDSETARPRVAQPREMPGPGEDALRKSLPGALRGLRRARGLTQPALATRLGLSVTTVCHAETGRLWQSRDFWRAADGALGGEGELVRLYDSYQTARHAPALAPPRVPRG
jgi:hypothetical protein